MRINLLTIALIAALALAAVGIILPPALDLLDSPAPFEIQAQQQGPLVLLTWEVQQGAVIYQVQGRMFDGDWSTIGLLPAPLMRTALPPGVASFRVRAWTEDGPGAWSKPSEFLIFLPTSAPAPAPPEPRRDGAMNLLWDPALLPPGEFDNPDDA